jgi:hypothetical protein
MQGRVQFTMEEDDNYNINTDGWATGIYIVEITDKSTMEIIQHKVVVQR